MCAQADLILLGTKPKSSDLLCSMSYQNFFYILCSFVKTNTITVLQLEIFHGVLNNPDAAKKRSFFYMRKPPVETEMDENEFKVRSSTG